MPFDRAHPDEYVGWSDDGGPTSIAEMAATGSFSDFSGSTLRKFSTQKSKFDTRI